MKTIKQIPESIRDKLECIEIIREHSGCAYCRYNAKNYPKTLPKECTECMVLNARNAKPYWLMPVWKEGVVPTSEENKAICGYTDYLVPNFEPAGLPPICVGDRSGF